MNRIVETYCPNCGTRKGGGLKVATAHNVWCDAQRPKPHPDFRLAFANGWCLDKSVYPITRASRGKD